MKLNTHFLAGAILAAALLPSTSLLGAPAHENLGAEKQQHNYKDVRIKNLQDEPLGRVQDLGLDLVNGRIVEVLVTPDSSLGMGDKVVAVPPLALSMDPTGEVYRLNISTAAFKSAAVIDLTKWEDAGRSDRVAAAYRVFGQDPYFLEEGETASKTADRPKVTLGYVERSSKIQDLPVSNYQGEKFGKVWSLTMNITKGRILSVVILAPGNFETKSVVPAMALNFNAKRDGLLLDDTKAEYADEPRYVFTAAAYGQEAHYAEESYKGPHTTAALEQGYSDRDLDRTGQIHRDIRTAKVNGRNVEIGTLNGRVTLRGWVYSADDKRRIGEIAVAASRLELVDNQITVGRPSAQK